MKADMHVHTYFSCDSMEYMERYCDRAMKNGLSYLCFTDHVDFNPKDEGFGFYEAEKYFDELTRIQNRYKNDITILSGIEFSEPHLYQKELIELSKYPYDFIIGSIHYVKGVFPDEEAMEKYTFKEYFRLYWHEVLQTVTIGHFDSLGHIDFPKRCLGEAYYDYEVIDKIFQTMVRNQIALEINTSSLRYGLKSTLPGLDLLLRYKNQGGKYITIGSDTHKEAYLAQDNEIAKALIKKLELQEVVFEKHKPIPII